MRFTHYAMRSSVAAALSVALAACGKSTGPSTFDPQGTSTDMAVAQDAFASQPVVSLAAVGIDISAALNGSAAVLVPPALALRGPSAASAAFARKLVTLLPRGGSAIQASVATVPSAVLGTTFVWGDTGYVASDLAGAPANGVRFALYAVDPIQLRPVLPLVEVGYADILDQGSGNTIDVRLKVVQANVIYLDYDVTATPTGSGGLVTLTGFATNGSSRVDFSLKNTVTNTTGGVVLSLAYDINVPSRGLSLDWTATFANISATQVTATLDLSIAGPHGDVRLVGTYGANGGTFTVKVNGDPFATVTQTDSGPVITDPQGNPLTPDEEEALQRILDYYDQSQGAFSDLLMPIS